MLIKYSIKASSSYHCFYFLCSIMLEALYILIYIFHCRGIHHVIVDYCPKIAQPIVDLMWKALFLVQLGGLAYINYYDVGICKLVALTLNI